LKVPGRLASATSVAIAQHSETVLLSELSLWFSSTAPALPRDGR
jgi:hypothetical protein